jgi:hypothetical protein
LELSDQYHALAAFTTQNAVGESQFRVERSLNQHFDDVWHQFAVGYWLSSFFL